MHVYPNTDFYVLNYLLLLLLCDLKRSLIDSLAFLNILGSSGHFDIRDCYITVQKLFTLALAMKKIFECRKSKCFLPKPGNQDLRSFFQELKCVFCWIYRIFCSMQMVRLPKIFKYVYCNECSILNDIWKFLTNPRSLHIVVTTYKWLCSIASNVQQHMPAHCTVAHTHTHRTTHRAAYCALTHYRHHYNVSNYARD